MNKRDRARWTEVFRHASKALGRVPSLVWGALYLLCIPAFAILYSGRPSEFFHATAAYEPVSEDVRNRIGTALAKAIEDNFIEKHGRNSVEIEGKEISVEDVSVYFSPVMTSYTSGFNFDFKAKEVTVEAHVVLGMGDYFVYRLKVVGDNDVARYPHIAFPCPQGFLSGGLFRQDDACLVIGTSTIGAIETYTNIKRGFPSGREAGSFWRLLYFSAVTITTLGYGDIVPLTTVTRAIVTVEIILGPILFGLFLNSLVREGLQPEAPNQTPAADV